MLSIKAVSNVIRKNKISIIQMKKKLYIALHVNWKILLKLSIEIQPNLNYPNEKQELYCNDCKLENMIDVRHKKCIICKKVRPDFNYPNEEKLYIVMIVKNAVSLIFRIKSV